MYGIPINRADTEQEALDLARKYESIGNQLARIGANTLLLGTISPILGVMNIASRLYAGGLDTFYVTKGQGSMQIDLQTDEIRGKDNYYVQKDSPLERELDGVGSFTIPTFSLISGIGINHALGAGSELDYILNPVTIDIITKSLDLMSRLF